MARGLFITFEGGEGAGKSTQVTALADRLASKGREVVRTREPGGSPGAEAIRALLVTGGVNRWSPVTETLLMNAARRDHLERVIEPALARDAVVVCDRFADSTRAYQGAGGGAPDALIGELERAVVGATRPDLTLLLDIDPAVGLARSGARQTDAHRFEQQDLAYHRRLRAAFLALADAEPGRFAIINANAPCEVVTAAVWAAVSERVSVS